jgi:hypothetical protein
MKSTKKAQIAAITAISLVGLGVANPAMAFNFSLNSLMDGGYSNMLTKVQSGFQSQVNEISSSLGLGQNFFQKLNSLGGSIVSTAQGLQGIPDFDKLFANISKSNANSNSSNSIAAQGQKIDRQVTDVAAAVGTAPLTEEGQKQNIELLTKISSARDSANTATQAALQADNSLEAIKHGIEVTNAATEQMASYSYLQTQAIQVGAANVQVSKAVHNEMKSLNNYHKSLQEEHDSIVAKTQSIPLPLLSNK